MTVPPFPRLQDEVLVSGYLLRQGTVLSFNWKKHYWVLTKHGSAPSLCKVTHIYSYVGLESE